MCVKKKVFLNLCELYPKTEEALKVLSLEKRKLYIHYLNEANNIKIRASESGVPRMIESRESRGAERGEFPRARSEEPGIIGEI